MTKIQFRKNVKKMLPDLRKHLLDRIEKMLKSGCVDLNEYDNDFKLPRIFMNAALKEAAWQYKPHDNKAKKEAENMYHFL